jgi:hypothetical protein
MPHFGDAVSCLHGPKLCFFRPNDVRATANGCGLRPRRVRRDNSGNPARHRRRPISPRAAARSAARGAGKVRGGPRANPAPEGPDGSQSRQARPVGTRLALAKP